MKKNTTTEIKRIFTTKEDLRSAAMNVIGEVFDKVVTRASNKQPDYLLSLDKVARRHSRDMEIEEIEEIITDMSIQMISLLVTITQAKQIIKELRKQEREG